MIIGQNDKRLKLVLSNCYGYDNVGDQAILTCMIDLLKDNFNGVEIDVLSRWPSKTRRRHANINPVRSGIFRGIISTCKSIKNADLLIFGGGGIIQDASSFGNLLFHLSRLLMARLLGIPFIGCGLGVGPIRNKFGRWLASTILNQAEGLYVRDVCSAILLNDINVVKPPIVVTSDFANSLSFPENIEEEPVYQQVMELKQQSSCLIGLSLRPQAGKHKQLDKLSLDFANTIKEIAKACDKLIEKQNATLVFVPMEPKEDKAIAQHFLSFLKNKDKIHILSGDLKPKVIMSIIGLFDIMLGMRLHSLIFAIRSLVPIVAFNYDPKIVGFCKLLDQDEKVLKLQDLDAERLFCLAEDTLIRRDEISQSLKEYNLKLKAGVEKNVNAINELVDSY